jgi:hypothetical protein
MVGGSYLNLFGVWELTSLTRLTEFYLSQCDLPLCGGVTHGGGPFAAPRGKAFMLSSKVGFSSHHTTYAVQQHSKIAFLGKRGRCCGSLCLGVGLLH